MQSLCAQSAPSAVSVSAQRRKGLGLLGTQVTVPPSFQQLASGRYYGGGAMASGQTSPGTPE